MGGKLWRVGLPGAGDLEVSLGWVPGTPKKIKRSPGSKFGQSFLGPSKSTVVPIVRIGTPGHYGASGLSLRAPLALRATRRSRSGWSCQTYRAQRGVEAYLLGI